MKSKSVTAELAKESRYEIARAILERANCRHLGDYSGPCNSRMELWAVPDKGILIVQVRATDTGVTVFADWPLGHTWSELRIALGLESPVVSAAEDAERARGKAALAFLAEILQCGSLDPLEDENPSMHAGISALVAGAAYPMDNAIKALGVLGRLHDGLSDMIEGGRLKKADIPDDYQWLVSMLVNESLPLFAEGARVKGVPVESPAALINRVFQKANEETESWREDFIGSDLAYLAWAIAAGPGKGCVEWDVDNRTMVLFKHWFSESDPVWQFIKQI